jgi:hypothetical protein
LAAVTLFDELPLWRRLFDAGLDEVLLVTGLFTGKSVLVAAGSLFGDELVDDGLAPGVNV